MRRAFLLSVVLGSLAVVSCRSPKSEAQPIAERKAAPNPVVSSTEMEYFRKKYGPNHYSEREEEWMIRDYFQDRRDGIFVDVGAHHFKSASKTYFLEEKLGWSGLAIEPQREFAEEYTKYRPRTKFLPFFVSDVSNEKARLYVLNKMRSVASSNSDFVKQFGRPDEVREVPTITLTDLLHAQGIKQIDFLSM